MKQTIKTLTIGLMALASMAACDKIEPGSNGEYTVYAGTTAEWTAGNPIANPVLRAYVEKYTGPRCTNCPAADRTLAAVHEQVGDRMVQISVNSMTDQFGAPGPNSPDMRTEDGAVWETYWGVSSFPTAFVNHTSTAFTGDMATIGAAVQQAAAEAPVLAMEGTVSGTSNIAIDINLQFVQQYADPITLTLALVEDSLAYWQLDGLAPDPDYVHNHMLRDVITDPWGADIDCTGAAGEARKARFEYTLPEGVGYWHVVAMVCDKASRRVLNSVVCE